MTDCIFCRGVTGERRPGGERPPGNINFWTP